MSISYQITAMFTRYILVLLALLVLIRVITLAHSKRANIDQSIGCLKSLSRDITYPVFLDNTIGRSGKCDIQIRNRTIAPLHAQIIGKKNKIYLVACTSGDTWLNGIEIKDKIDIQDGDILTIGDEEFIIELEGGGR